jgi:hypothetical protein
MRLSVCAVVDNSVLVVSGWLSLCGSLALHNPALANYSMEQDGGLFSRTLDVRG